MMQSSRPVITSLPTVTLGRAASSGRAPFFASTAPIAGRLARQPIHPGRFLETRFLRPSGLSQDALAHALGISRRRVNELIRGRRGFTPDTALRLSLFFRTDPHLWLGLQAAWDMYQAWRALGSGSNR